MEIRINKKPKLYEVGNLWQKKVYQHMALFLYKKNVKNFGQSLAGTQYKHLLTEKESEKNFINDDIYRATIERFNNHKAGDLHRILTNTAASQTYCFNLFIYLKQYSSLADKLFSNLLSKEIKVKHIEPEFTPNQCDKISGFERKDDESIGDQNGNMGTDSDIAIFYTYDNNKKGVLLIEFKFIEHEFSVCTSFKNKEKIKLSCKSETFYIDLIDKKVEKKDYSCGYKKYFNWRLTQKSEVISNNKVKLSSSCPFRLGLNQLWRNMLLAEQVSNARSCDEFSFWVLSPRANDKYLWEEGKIEKQFREILTEKGNNNFQKFHLETIFDNLKAIVIEENDKNWLKELELKYRIE